MQLQHISIIYICTFITLTPPPSLTLTSPPSLTLTSTLILFPFHQHASPTPGLPKQTNKQTQLSLQEKQQPPITTSKSAFHNSTIHPKHSHHGRNRKFIHIPSPASSPYPSISRMDKHCIAETQHSRTPASHNTSTI